MGSETIKPGFLLVRLKAKEPLPLSIRRTSTQLGTRQLGKEKSQSGKSQRKIASLSVIPTKYESSKNPTKRKRRNQIKKKTKTKTQLESIHRIFQLDPKLYGLTPADFSPPKKEKRRNGRIEG